MKKEKVIKIISFKKGLVFLFGAFFMLTGGFLVHASTSPIINPIAPITAIIGQKTTFTVVASSPDNLPLTLSAGIIAGSTFDPSTGVYSITPTASQIGNYAIGISAFDGVNTSSQSVSLSIVPAVIPDPPVIKTIDPITVTTGQLVSFTVQASNPGGLPLLYDGNLLAGMAINSSTGLFTFDTTNLPLGTYEAQITVSDNVNPEVIMPVSITIIAKTVPASLEVSDNNIRSTSDTKLNSNEVKNDSNKISAKKNQQKVEKRNNSSKNDNKKVNQ
jgi:hypothetical protein